MNHTSKYDESISSLIVVVSFVRSFFVHSFTCFQSIIENPTVCLGRHERQYLLPLLVSVRDLEEVWPRPSPMCFYHSRNCEIRLAHDPHRRPLSDAETRTTTDFRREVGDTPFHRSNISEANTYVSIYILILSMFKYYEPDKLSPSAADMVLTYLRYT